MSEQEHNNVVHANDDAFKAYDKEGASGNGSVAPVLATEHIPRDAKRDKLKQSGSQYSISALASVGLSKRSGRKRFLCTLPRSRFSSCSIP